MGAIPHESMHGLLCIIKHKNDMHVPAALRKLAIRIAIGGLVFELSKLRVRPHNS